MPVYNGEKTIGIALASLLNQTYTNWICVIVNDGSSDNTATLIDAFADDRFIVINLEKNRGRGYARQIALENAKGDYLTYLDADDFYHADKLRRQVETFAQLPEASLVACGLGSFDARMRLITVRGNLHFMCKYFTLGDDQHFVPVTSMIRLERARHIQYNTKLNASEDSDYFSRYLDGKQYVVMDEVLYYYREFESHSYTKTMAYAWYAFMQSMSMFKHKKNIRSLLATIVVIVKTVVYAVAVPFVGMEYFLKRRGRLPTDRQQDEFLSQHALHYSFADHLIGTSHKTV
jgi:glycosyltransferase involved in cell wall biosynthesis